jgi:hypothetical protein
MTFLRFVLPHASVVVGLLVTAAWMVVLSYGVFQVSKWTLIWLAELLL